VSVEPAEPPTLADAIGHYRRAVDNAETATMEASRLRGTEAAVADANVAQAWATCGELALSLHFATESGGEL
jgi:hypothetical protein